MQITVAPCEPVFPGIAAVTTVSPPTHGPLYNGAAAKESLLCQDSTQGATPPVGFTEQQCRLNPALQERCGTMVAAAEWTVAV